VIATAEGTRALDRDQVEWLLNHTEGARVARIIRADSAAHFISNMAADLAGSRLFARRADRSGEGLCVGERRAQKVEGEPFGGSRPNAGEAGERFDESLKRARE
jgi:hypothetical protein